VTDQAGHGDTIDVGVDAKISFAVYVEKVQRDENGGILPEFDFVERDVHVVFVLRLGNGTTLKVHCADGRAENVLAILWIGDPASLCGVEVCVSPRFYMEREPVHVNAAGSHAEAPVVVRVEVDEVQEYNDLGRGDKPALKVDAHGRRVTGFPLVLTSEKVQIAGCEDEDAGDATEELGGRPGCDVAVSPGVAEVRDRRLDADVGAFVYI